MTMIMISTVEDINALRESFDVECKLAQGKDGQGACPKNLWETYSAFANTQGGYIFLGLKEIKHGHFELAGIPNAQKVIDEIWTGLNDSDLVSCNVLSALSIQCIRINELNIIQMHVPRATRKQQPVYIRGNPVKGTYKRFNSADLKQSEEMVRRMLAEQIEDSRDNEVLKGYDLNDIDTQSLLTYRQRYANRQPDHPWNKLNNQEFMRVIGAWRDDRETGLSGLTRAGLLMFGQLHTIKESFPNYMLDFQERPEAQIEARWIDRITLDGTWSGNLFDFYQRVIRKLTADLKVPFELKGDERQEDTPVHTALREALVNTLVHADYSGRASLLVVKRPDMFGFRNPGTMRVPIDIALLGGESDCRNRIVQDLFRYIGLGEHSGSGLPKILDGWSSQHWRQPLLTEKETPSEQTLLELHTLSLVPEVSIQQLRDTFGDETLGALSEAERLILVTALIEKTVDHRRMMAIINLHPRDLSAYFASLVEKNLMSQEGNGRGTVYFLPEARIIDAANQREAQKGLGVSFRGLGVSSGGYDALKNIAQPVASKKRAAKLLVEETILALCRHMPCSLEMLSDLLNRSHEVIRKDYLQPMIKDRRLCYLYPTSPNHPEQAYATPEIEK
jgi:predicted HTH transcriptional regulator